MTISILTDNSPGGYTQAEHGLSYLIEHDGIRLLFDTGQSNLFKKNAGAMGIDLTNLDMVILSHGHFDHGNGLEHLGGGHLMCHPGCFVNRYQKANHSYIGLKYSKEEISRKFSLNTSKEPYQISEKIIFLGEIPRMTNFESQITPFVFEDETPDFVMDDSAIAILVNKGIFVVTGCGHAGIVNTLEHAKKVTGENKIYGIIGGFHLKEIDLQTRQTIYYLKENKVKHVYPSHCTALPALSAFYESFRIKQVKTGDAFKF